MNLRASVLESERGCIYASVRYMGPATIKATLYYVAYVHTILFIFSLRPSASPPADLIPNHLARDCGDIDRSSRGRV